MPKLTDAYPLELTDLVDADLLYGVDIGDTTDNVAGSSKKITVANTSRYISINGTFPYDPSVPYKIGTRVIEDITNDFYISIANGNENNALSNITKWSPIGKLAPTSTISIKQASDIGPSGIAPDGIDSYFMDKAANYSVDVGAINLDKPIWIYGVGAGVTGFNFSATVALPVINYTGPAGVPVMRGVDIGAIFMQGLLFLSLTPGNQFFDLHGSFNANAFPVITMDNCVWSGPWELGIVRDLVGWGLNRSSLNGYASGFTFHNIFQIINRDVFAPASAGGVNLFNVTGFNQASFFSDLNYGSAAGDSMVAVDENLLFLNQMSFSNVKFTAAAGGQFYQPDLTGSITAYADLSPLINGSIVAITQFTDNGNIEVELSGTGDYYLGLDLLLAGTVNYDGVQKIQSVIQTSPSIKVVLDVAYSVDEAVGTYAAQGTRVTTSAAHILTPERTTTISGTTGYNNYHIVLNPDGGAGLYDINQAFAGDDATGSYFTTSLNQKEPNISARDCGASPNSKTLVKLNFEDNTAETVITVLGQNEPINTNIPYSIASNIERFLVQDVVTFDNATNTLNTTFNHGLSNNDKTPLHTYTGTLPAELSADTRYFVINVTATSWQLSPSRDGDLVSFTDNGSGVNYYRHSTGTSELAEPIYNGVNPTSVNTNGWAAISNSDASDNDFRTAIQRRDLAGNYSQDQSGSKVNADNTKPQSTIHPDILSLEKGESPVIYIRNDSNIDNLLVESILNTINEV